MITNVTFTATDKRRKLVSMKRIGGLYHWRIGALARKRHTRYTYAQCGNCIDIMQHGRTVAYLNIGTGTAQSAFNAWLAQDKRLAAHLTRAVERLALAGIAGMIVLAAIL